MWWIGGWWAFGEHRYGERKAIVTADGWEGPAYETCRKAASVARAFPPPQRHHAVTFYHHTPSANRSGCTPARYSIG
jgi:hypothetical protein